VAGLSQLLRRRGLNNVAIDGVRPLPGSGQIVGTARTLRFVPNREDLFTSHGGGYNAQKRVFDAVAEGEVIVIEARGDATAGTLGDVLALRARANGAAGIITDGAVRDYEAVAAVGIPVYGAAAHPAVLGRRHVPWDHDLTISCGGATVQPGDIILTGTPAGSSVAQLGDLIEVEVDDPSGGRSTGRLRTRVVEGEGPAFDPALGSLPAVDDTQRIAAWGSAEEAGLPAEPTAYPEQGSAPTLTPALRTLLAQCPVAGLSQQLRRRGPYARAQQLRVLRQRDRVHVGDEVEGVVLVLQRHPLADRAQVVAQVERVGGGLDPRQHAGLARGRRGLRAHRGR